MPFLLVACTATAPGHPPDNWHIKKDPVLFDTLGFLVLAPADEHADAVARIAYGGESVRPLRIRCFACNDYDVAASGGGGYYTAYYHGRWMKY